MICSQLVKQFDGELGVYSAGVNKGSTFMFTMNMLTMPPEFTNLDMFDSETNINESELMHETISDFTLPTPHNVNAGLTNRINPYRVNNITGVKVTSNESISPSHIQADFTDSEKSE